MTTKIIAGIVVVLIIIAGVWYLATRSSSSPNSGQPAAAASANTASSTNQVQGQDVSVGTGAVAQPGDTISVLYVGKLPDGTVFDSSAAHGNQPLTFVLGQNGLIPGFQIGVNGMKVGGERLLSIPPSLGYGAQPVKDASGTVIIPANSTLLFDVKLVDVKPGTTTPATSTPTAAH